MIISWKVTKKKLKPFLDERGVELMEYKSSYTNYYFLSVKGAGHFQPMYHNKIHFRTLKSILIFLLRNPEFSSRNIDWVGDYQKT